MGAYVNFVSLSGLKDSFPCMNDTNSAHGRYSTWYCILIKQSSILQYSVLRHVAYLLLFTLKVLCTTQCNIHGNSK